LPEQLLVPLLQPLSVVQGGGGLLHVGLGAGESPLRLLQRSLEEPWVDLREPLAFLHRAVEIDEKLGNGAGHLAADVDGDDGGHFARRGYHLDDGTAADRIRAIGVGGSAATTRDRRGNGDERETDAEPMQDSFSLIREDPSGPSR